MKPEQGPLRLLILLSVVLIVLLCGALLAIIEGAEVRLVLLRLRPPSPTAQQVVPHSRCKPSQANAGRLRGFVKRSRLRSIRWLIRSETLQPGEAGERAEVGASYVGRREVREPKAS